MIAIEKRVCYAHRSQEEGVILCHGRGYMGKHQGVGGEENGGKSLSRGYCRKEQVRQSKQV